MAGFKLDLRIEPLSTDHDCDGFSREVDGLDPYPPTQSRQDVRRKANGVFILVESKAPRTVLGYYTLCATTLQQGDVSVAARKYVPRYPLVSATLIGRLAVSAARHGERLGGILLADAAPRAYQPRLSFLITRRHWITTIVAIVLVIAALPTILHSALFWRARQIVKFMNVPPPSYEVLPSDDPLTILHKQARQASRQKCNIRRFIGYGSLDPDDAVACVADRATFWAVGSLKSERSVDIAIPVPSAIGGRAQLHSISATLAWFTPVVPGRKSYKAVRMKILHPVDIASLGVAAHENQPDGNQTNRGTVCMRCWIGDRAAVVTANMTLSLRVQREPDAGETVDDPVPFGIAVTVARSGQIALYDELRARVRPQAQRERAR